MSAVYIYARVKKTGRPWHIFEANEATARQITFGIFRASPVCNAAACFPRRSVLTWNPELGTLCPDCAMTVAAIIQDAKKKLAAPASSLINPRTDRAFTVGEREILTKEKQ